MNVKRVSVVVVSMDFVDVDTAAVVMMRWTMSTTTVFDDHLLLEIYLRPILLY